MSAATSAPGVDPGTSQQPRVDSDFEAALRAAQQTAAADDVSELPSVPLGHMLAVYASGASMPAPPGARDAHGAQTAAVASMSQPASTGGVAATIDGPGGRAILAAGEQYLGVPYLWGGTDPAIGLDCSGFVQQVFGDLGVDLPRVSADQAKVGSPVGGLADAQPGDLLFWRGEGGRPNHIAIYAGDGRMLDAPRTGEVVGYRDITRGAPDTIRRVIA